MLTLEERVSTVHHSGAGCLSCWAIHHAPNSTTPQQCPPTEPVRAFRRKFANRAGHRISSLIHPEKPSHQGPLTQPWTYFNDAARAQILTELHVRIIPEAMRDHMKIGIELHSALSLVCPAPEILFPRVQVICLGSDP